MKTDPNAAAYDPVDRGLTKRELFAAMAMQGLLSGAKNPATPEEFALGAAVAADALIKELNR